MYSFQQAYPAIEAWKAHQLRSIQQDKARLNIIDTLAESSVLITQDWAMKFLPESTGKPKPTGLLREESLGISVPSYVERETCNTKHLSTL